MKAGKVKNSDIPRKTSFCGIYNNKALLKTLEFASDNSGLVSAGATLALSTIVRPLSIMNTKTKNEEDKKYASSKSIISGVLGFALSALIYGKISKGVNNVTNNPQKFLTDSTIKTLKGNAETLSKSDTYNFLKQNAKLLPEYLAIVPKAILTTTLITPIVQHLFKSKDNDKNKIQNPSFKGRGKIEKIFSKIAENKSVQDFSKKMSKTNFIQHALCLKDIFATGVFALAVKANKDIKRENKKPLVYNALISTGLTIAGSYAMDKTLEKPLQKLNKNFIKANKNDPKLHKYLQGEKVLKPILILGGIYYILIPKLATIYAEKFSKRESGDILCK